MQRFKRRLARPTPLQLGRRRALQGAGALAALFPWLTSLREARGAEGTGARRLIVFGAPGEPIGREYWAPPGVANESALTNLTPVMSALEPFRSKLLVIGDLDMTSRMQDPRPYEGHSGFTHLLVGRNCIEYGPTEYEALAGGISVDQHIANARGVDAVTLAVLAGSGSPNAASRMSYRGPSEPIDPIGLPDVAFEALFADARLPPSQLLMRRAQRLSVLDRVTDDITRLRPALGAEARAKLDTHAELLRELENKIAADNVVECDPPTIEVNPEYRFTHMFPTTTRRQIDVMVAALACGMTDVASLQLNNSAGGAIWPPWPDEGVELETEFHVLSHQFIATPNDPEVIEHRTQVEAVLYRLFAYLLERLDAIPEGDADGTMLDHSLVLWGKPLAHAHSFDRMLFMLAGGAGGQLETGRFLSFPGRPHNDLLINVCNLMGLGDETFGDPAYCTGPLTL